MSSTMRSPRETQQQLDTLNDFGIWSLASRILDDDLYSDWLEDFRGLVNVLGEGEQSTPLTPTERTILREAITCSISYYPYQEEHLETVLEDEECVRESK